ncbi:MAG: AsmA family protein [Sulfuricella sp.]
MARHDASLSSVGNSVASLLGASNGEIKILINQGTVSKLLLEEMGLNIGNVILARLAGDKQVKLNCMATDFGVTHGLMQARSFIIRYGRCHPHCQRQHQPNSPG